MKQLMLMMTVLAAGWILPGYGDEFEDFIQACARISANYNRVVQSPGTRFEKEYQTHLEHLKKLSAHVQSVIRKMQLGQDFNFPQLVMELEYIYQGQLASSGVKGSAKLHAHSESPEGILRILTDDVKELRKMEFTMEEGGSIKSSLETRRKLNEFRRLTVFFRKNYRALSRNPGKKDVSRLRIFQSRMMRMSALSNILVQMAGKQYPDTSSKQNLQSETVQLSRLFDALAEVAAKNNHSSRSRNRSKNGSHTSNRRLDGLNTSAALISEINLCLRNIDEQLIQWEQAGFQSDEPILKKNRTDSDDPAAPLLKANETKGNYHGMDRQALSDLLQRRRQAIIRSNSSMDGFDKDAERLFFLTLSREQKRSYNDYLRDFQQQGYSSGQSVRSAVLKIHTRIQLEKQLLPEKELIRILKALDKEEERRQEKNDVKFKLERSRS